MVFIKDGDFRYDAFVGREVYSQQIRKCFGKNYKQGIIHTLIVSGYMRVVSDKYSNFKENKFCKKYALTEDAVEFYWNLKQEVEGPKFKAPLPQKRFNTAIQEYFVDSVDYFQYSIKDARIHSPWVTVARDIRHSHVNSDGLKLILDLDLKTAFPSALLELLDRWVCGLGGLVGFLYNGYIQCSTFYTNKSFPSEVQKYKQLFTVDFYDAFISILKIEVSRAEVKRIVNCIFNSSNSDRSTLLGIYKQASDRFTEEFPLIDSIIREINNGPLHVGALLAREFEAPVIFNLAMAINSSGMFEKMIPIHDGIEIWGHELSQVQREKLEEIADEVLKGYKYIRISFKIRDVNLS